MPLELQATMYELIEDWIICIWLRCSKYPINILRLTIGFFFENMIVIIRKKE
jgi:hypothetical protein